MKAIITSSILFFTLLSFSQATLSGKIVDDKDKPITGANVYIEGTYDGATTNTLGEFNFTTTVEGTQNLVVSMLNYETSKVTIVIAEYHHQTIILKPNATQLNEVTITAGTIEAGTKSKVSVLTNAGSM